MKKIRQLIWGQQCLRALLLIVTASAASAQTMPDDIFAAPLVTIKDLNARKTGLDRRVRLRGALITIMESRTLILHDGSGAAAVLAGDPASASPEVAGRGVPLPPMQPGDVIEAAGEVVDQTDYNAKFLGMVRCHARVVGRGAVPEPEEVSLETFLAYRDEARWVIPSLAGLLRDFLGFDRAGMVVPRAELPPELSFYAPEGGQEIRPSLALGRGPFTAGPASATRPTAARRSSSASTAAAASDPVRSPGRRAPP